MSDERNGKPADDTTGEPTWKTTLPFPRQWLVYIAVKLVVLALAIWLALRWYGLV